MVFEIVHHQVSRRVHRCPVCVRTLYMHVPIYWNMVVNSHRDLWRVEEVLDNVAADCRAKTVILAASDEGFWMAPTPLQDGLPFKMMVLQDIRRLLRFGQRVKITITVV